MWDQIYWNITLNVTNIGSSCRKPKGISNGHGEDAESSKSDAFLSFSKASNLLGYLWINCAVFFLNMVPYFIENNFVWLTHTGAFSQRYSQITWNVWQTSFSSEAAVRRCSSKGVLKNFAIFTGKHLCWSFFLIKLQAYRPAALLKRNSNTGVFYEYWASCEICSKSTVN